MQQTVLLLATSEWLRLAPSLLTGVRDTVAALPDGVTLGDALFRLPGSAAARAAASATVAPTVSQMSTLSLSAPGPHSRTPSAGSGASRPSPRQAVVDITDRPSRPLPRRLIPTKVPSVVIPVSRPAPSASSPVAGPAAAPSRSSVKRPAADMVTPAYMPLEHRPSGWPMCEFCRRRKSKCRPPVGAKPPYDACSVCLNLGQPCKPVPAKPPHVPKARAEAPPPKPVAAVASSGSSTLDRPPVLLLRESFPTRLPSLPLHGSSEALLGDLIAWHAEIERAMAEHAAAFLARDAALVRVLQADDRRGLA